LLLSWFSTDSYAYPIRIRFPNIITGKVQWLTIGYIPIIKLDSEDASEKARVRVLKDAVFQRCRAVLMHRFVPASQTGELMTVPGHDEPVLAASGRARNVRFSRMRPPAAAPRHV